MTQDVDTRPQPLSAGMIYCHGCGKPIHESARSCPNCGAVARGARSGRSKWSAAILAFFLGGFGVHRFYLGQPIVGLIYLLFCWTLVPALIAFFEFIYFLVISEEKFDLQYNR
ncbi:TM2 domain-containing protein [Salinicola sp. DM10]|uniref:TM2 domain-containing protein n=1 Tax=Salinicola sp. DM10 TaxID=2815721 RepID=UPI001E293851|nr:TM2 domain-containing protein [Salinicola sp. DM10]MCE3026860.1 TM2 domain-containing protein [Salinicola sp. DM10]